MIVTNPTDKDIHVQIEGVVYKCPADSSIKGVPAEHAAKWKTHTHEFIIVSDETSVKAEPKIEKKEEAVEAPLDLPEEVETAPKKGKK